MAKLPPGNFIAGLPTDLSAGLFCKGPPTRLTAGQLLFSEGDPGDGCYRIDAGLVKVTTMSLAGSERILAILGAGSIVGELSTIDEAPRTATVMALRDSELSFVSRVKFFEFADRHPDVYKYLMRLLARRLRETDGVIAASSFLSVKGRLARTMLTLADAFGKEVGAGRIVIRQRLSQSDLAAMSGTVRENVSRVLNEWQMEAVLTRTRGYYCIERTATLKDASRL